MKSGDDIAIKTNDLTKIFLRRNSLMSRLKKKKLCLSSMVYQKIMATVGCRLV